MNLRRSLRGRLCWGGLPPIVLSFLGTKKHDRERSGFAVTGAVKNGTGLSRFLIAVTGSGLLIGIRFFIPSAPFPPKARGRWGSDGLSTTADHRLQNKALYFIVRFLRQVG